MAACPHAWQLHSCEQIESGQLRSLYHCPSCHRWQWRRPELSGPQALPRIESVPAPCFGSYYQQVRGEKHE